MFKNRWIQLLFVISIFLHSLPSFAFILSPGNLANVQVNGIYASQPGGNYVISGQLGWTPLFELLPLLSLRPVAAVSMFKGSLDGSKFLAPEAQLLLSLDLGPLLIEGGGGVQTWLGQSVTSPMISVNLGWHLSSSLFSLVDRLVLGYSYLTAHSAKTTEIKLGVGISL